MADQFTHARGVVTALFDDEASANRAVESLVGAGFGRSEVSIAHDGAGEGRARYADEREEVSFWEALGDLFSSSDRSAYSEGMRRGGWLVSVGIDSTDEEAHAARILDNSGAIDIDERASTWRDAGWAGEADVEREAAREATIPVAEERLKVGKRVIKDGKARVHTRVVEEPIEEQVRLQEEHVDVSRRPATGSTAPGHDPFEEKTVEVQAMREEPVVSKEAQVNEEVVVGKTAEEHTETVRDTVRHTEVDVEEDDTAARATPRTDIPPR